MLNTWLDLTVTSMTRLFLDAVEIDSCLHLCSSDIKYVAPKGAVSRRKGHVGHF